MSTVLSIKVSDSEKECLRQEASRRKISMSALLKQGLAVVLEDAGSESGSSFYDRAAEYFETSGHVGSSGLGDLSHNKERLKGFGT